MFLVLLLPTTIAVALSSNPDGDDRVIDLQELLSNVSRSYRDFEQDIKNLGSDITNNVNENINLVIENANDYAKRHNQNLKLILKNLDANVNHTGEIMKVVIEHVEEFANINANRIDVSLQKNTQVLEKLLKSFNTIVDGQDCADLYRNGAKSSGTYIIKLPGFQESFRVFCDMTTDGGGWTVFQRRGDYGFSDQYFFKSWDEYKYGFGALEKEFWLGNDRLSALSQQKVVTLRVDLWDLEGNQAYAKYSDFRVENEHKLYQLFVDGYSGNAGDSLIPHNSMFFSTKDRDNDMGPTTHCARDFTPGAWWYINCHASNLNGRNLKGNPNNYTGINWVTWKNSWYSMAATEMKIRPVTF